MKPLAKLTALFLFTVSLSGCAVTQNVLQDKYDEKALAECTPTAGGNDSIHTTSTSRCLGGSYEAKPKKKTWEPSSAGSG